MTDYKYVAAYDINKVFLSELESKGLINLQNYNADGFDTPLVPIIPAQQVPEFNNLLPGKPYIVYDVMQRPVDTQWWMSEETITYGVTSRDASEIQTMINLATDMFRRFDLSAQDVNLTLVAGSPYKYYYFKIESADPIQAFHDEGGFMTGNISILYSYSREVDSTTGRYL